MRGRDRARPRPERRSAAGPLAFILVVVVLVIGIALVGRPLAEDAIVGQVAEHDTLLKQSFIRTLVADRVGAEPDLAKDPRAESRSFVISRGETAGSIARRLQADGFIQDALAFELVLYDTGRESALQSGTYTISAGLTPRELARVFEKAPSEQAVLRIIEGWRLDEVATAVSKAFPKIAKDEFLKAAVVGTRRNTVLSGLPPEAPLVGYLFPDTYFFKPDASADQIVDALLDQFELRVGQTLRQAAADRKTNVYDIVKLDADPTIQYALGEWRELTLDDLKLDSPYNTYVVAGLPPTPICSPGAAALEGAAEPAEVPFATTLEEHEANRVKYGNK